MEKTITINMTLDTDTGRIKELDMVEGLYDRTEYISDWDKPLTIREVMAWLREDLEFMVG